MKCSGLMWDSSEWSHETQKGVATAVVYLVNDVNNLNDNSESGQFKS